MRTRRSSANEGDAIDGFRQRRLTQGASHTVAVASQALVHDNHVLGEEQKSKRPFFSPSHQVSEQGDAVFLAYGAYEVGRANERSGS